MHILRAFQKEGKENSMSDLVFLRKSTSSFGVDIPEGGDLFDIVLSDVEKRTSGLEVIITSLPKGTAEEICKDINTMMPQTALIMIAGIQKLQAKRTSARTLRSYGARR